MEQVLIALSGLVAAHSDGFQATLGAVAELDLIFARARLSLAWDASPVEWNDAGLVDLKGARHPLLGKAATGNRIRMAADSPMLIVTGPNTGGKTLLLKTLGLLVIIARCGLHIPADEGSTLCYFEDVLADIGDNQSLQESLSTFSGHIANVAPMLTKAGPHTLILLDELGSGTDPHEGTGLGVALLEAFLQKGAYTLATTHLREIKEFGWLTPGCAIAGMATAWRSQPEQGFSPQWWRGRGNWCTGLPRQCPLLLLQGYWRPGSHSRLCTYSGCLHREELGCAVRDAVEQGRVDRRRYEQYVQLLHQMRLA